MCRGHRARSVVRHKTLFERAPIHGYNWGSVLEIAYYDHDGSLLFNRAYAAPEGRDGLVLRRRPQVATARLGQRQPGS